MSRSIRPLFDNAIYHITTRGNQQQPVFHNVEDYTFYLNKVWKYKNKFKFSVYAYCLMPNHIHCLMDLPNKDFLKKIMQGINQSYTIYFNKKYKKTGHLWQGRYGSKVVQKDAYLINCMSYIEYNPVRANICSRAEDYHWSSYKSRVFGKNDKILNAYRI